MEDLEIVEVFNDNEDNNKEKTTDINSNISNSNSNIDTSIEEIDTIENSIDTINNNEIIKEEKLNNIDNLDDQIEIIENIDNTNNSINDETELFEDNKKSNELFSKIEHISDENLDLINDNNIEQIEVIENNIQPNNLINDENIDLENNQTLENNNIENNNDILKNNDSINNLDQDLLNNPSYKILLEYGENLTDKEYITNPAIGRDTEIQQLIVILLTPEKSGILVGKPGIGKTAIVEGLSYKIKNGDVPNALKGYSIFKLNSAALTGTIPGTNELKVQYIVNHLKNLDKIMVFIDEIHTLIGNGEAMDFANIFKPVIDRGSIKIIGATTSDEYDRYILRDKAFVRRFQKIEVSEPTREMNIQIMMGTYPKFEKRMGLKLKYTDFIKERIMAFLTDITSEFKRVYEISARYPDISLTILQQAFSYTAFDNREEVSIRDVRKAILTTKLVYPDVIKKELIRFNDVFKDLYLSETKQILKDEV